MNQDRFRFFPVSFFETDLLIGVAHAQHHPSLAKAAKNEISRIRLILEKHIRQYPLFASSLEPLPISNDRSELEEELIEMLHCGIQSQTGPMSSVAGLFAERVGQRLVQEHDLEEVVVENGGDLFLKNSAPLISAIHAGQSPLSDKMAFVLPPGTRGICTSSGTIGHSYSAGKADALTVIAESTPLADSWATALANRVHVAGDIDPVLEASSSIPGILGCAIIAGGQIGIRGDFELKLLS